MPRRDHRLAVLTGIALAAGIIVPLELVAVAPASAYWACETAPPYSDYEGTSMEFVYSASGAAGDSLEIRVPDMCISSTASVTELSNADGVTVILLADGSNAATITLAPPTADFVGVSRVDLEVTDGAESYVLELYGLFGVAPTTYGFGRPAPVATALGAPAFFPISGTVPRPGATIRAEVVRSTQPVIVEWVDSPSDGIVVTPPASFRGTIGVQVVITDGITSTQTTLYQWAGIPIPTTAVWAPNPPPVAIEQGGIAYFDLSSGFVPFGSECEIRVRTEPDVLIAVSPPPLSGAAFAPVDIVMKDQDFVGLVTVSYDLSCELPDLSVSSVEYDLLVYVGIPIPELAATGPEFNVVPLGVGALALVLGGFVLLRRRAAILTRSR
ncbi:LPXTG cell wall anchor domain-containing protein [Microcella sp.]|uniref:LPXTG cell wall anchor domain-containing protein n=1 Tax=Microcella sp. TaxID=1913979 RepID=UPI00299F731D|nr:LPXTG cell wall anchor domain-containing protein [Microcella sp.]MDX2026293.1 LPXTG cell wall anchor domain-containing protein [Microcella sp.]